MSNLVGDGDQVERRSFLVGCRLDYEVRDETTFIFNVAPARCSTQYIGTENISVAPNIAMDEYVEQVHGNRYHRLCCQGQTSLSVQFDANVMTSPQPQNPSNYQLAALPSSLPLDMLTYLFPSRYCQSEQLQIFAQQEFSRFPRGLSQVEAICEWVHNNIHYVLGSTGSMTTAFDTFRSRAGVCRDFTHLAISFCRAVAIPARFVSGYAVGLDPPDFHALLEVWVADGWHLLDPTQKVDVNQFVRIGMGRDAAETSFAFIFGDAYMQSMNVSCLEHEKY